MAVVQIVEINAPSQSPSNGEIETPATVSKETIEKRKALIGTPKGPRHMTIGRQVQSPSTIQVTTERDDTPDLEVLTANLFTDLLQTTLGTPSLTYHIPLLSSQSLFGPDGAATGHITEYVTNFQRLSNITPSYTSKIESEFAEFYRTFDEEAKGALGLTTGWVAEEQGHLDLAGGEKANCFFVFNGWNRMEDFETSTSTESFKRALPISLGWRVPARLWHVEKIF